MNRIGVFTVLFLLGSSALAKTLDKHLQPKTFSTPAGSQSNCPMAIQAKLDMSNNGNPLPVQGGQSKDGSQGVQVAGKYDSKDNDHKLQITLSNTKSSKIFSTQITVHGFPVGARLVPVALDSLAEHPEEMAMTVILDRPIEAGQSTSLDVSVDKFGIVDSIEIHSVTYADGSSWHPSLQKSCRAVDTNLKSPLDVSGH